MGRSRHVEGGARGAGGARAARLTKALQDRGLAVRALPEGLALSAPMADVPELDELEKPEMSIVQDFPIKIYLTWREIASGGIKIPRSLGKELSHAREYTFTDPDVSSARAQSSPHPGWVCSNGQR